MIPPPPRIAYSSDHSFGEMFSNVQPEPSLVHLEAIPSSPITSYIREEADPQLTTTSLQVVIESEGSIECIPNR